MHKAENKYERYPGTCPGKSFANFCLTVTRVFKSLRLAWFLHSDSSTSKKCFHQLVNHLYAYFTLGLCSRSSTA